MSLSRRIECLRHSQMELPIPDGIPHAAASGKGVRLRNLLQSQKPSVKRPSAVFSTGRNGHLHVVKSKLHVFSPSPPSLPHTMRAGNTLSQAAWDANRRR